MKRKRWVSAKHWGTIPKRRMQETMFHNPEYARKRAIEGRELEGRVRMILFAMRDRGLFAYARANSPNSRADHDGEDFEVGVRSQEVLVPIPFGITSSFQSYKQFFKKHPGKDCVLIPMNASDEEIEASISRVVECLLYAKTKGNQPSSSD